MKSKTYHNKYYGLFCTACIVIMMWADKKVSAREISNALDQAKGSSEFDKKDIHAINHLYENFPDIVERIFIDAAEPLPANDKKMGLKMGFDMANSDGEFSVSEKVKLKELTKLAGFTDKDFEKLIKEILI